MPTLTQLQYVVAVANLKHFGKAAKTCHISQPSLSMQIQKAEEELGVSLFDREKKPVQITEKGIPLVEQARKILQAHEHLLQMSKAVSGEVSGNFKLGVIPTLSPYLVPLFLEGFANTYSKVNLVIEELKTEDMVEALRNDKLDAGLLATPLDQEGLIERPLFYEPFYVYAHPTHSLMKRKTLREEDLNPQEIWLLQDGHCFRQQVLNTCTRQKEPRDLLGNVRFASGNFETLRALIRGGRGYTLFPHLFIMNLEEKEKRDAVRPFATPIPTREVSLLYRRSAWKLEVLDALTHEIQKSVPQELLMPNAKKMVVKEIH